MSDYQNGSPSQVKKRTKKLGKEFVRLTAQQRLDELEKIPPFHVKNKLNDLLWWQATHGRHYVNVTWYLDHIIYSWLTRSQRRAEVRDKSKRDALPIGELLARLLTNTPAQAPQTNIAQSSKQTPPGSNGVHGAEGGALERVREGAPGLVRSDRPGCDHSDETRSPRGTSDGRFQRVASQGESTARAAPEDMVSQR